MRISDWSSDVCSSDLAHHRARAVLHQHEIGDIDRQFDRWIERMDRLEPGIEAELFLRLNLGRGGAALLAAGDERGDLGAVGGVGLRARVLGREIGRAPRRESVCRDGSISVVAVPIKKKKK